MSTEDRQKKAHQRRKKSIRKVVYGTSDRPRLSVFRSARHIYAQIIEDTEGRTLASASTLESDVRGKQEAGSKVDLANLTGKLLAQRALEKGITKVVFDRNGFLYHGRVRAVATGAREAGLDF